MVAERIFFPGIAAGLFFWGGSVAAEVRLTDDSPLQMPPPGAYQLRILSPTVLEITRINTKPPDPARVDSWDFVGGDFQLHAPAPSQFSVTVNGLDVAVTDVGFKRRALYAPVARRDLRIANWLYLQLATPVADNQTVVVQNPDTTLWPASWQLTAVADPLRYSPAIHVNQTGYVPAFPKKAMVGYYLGSLGELDLSSQTSFKLVNASTGAQVYQGTLVSRPDVGYAYEPTPYQKVLEADFTDFTTPGEYRLVVPGLGASYPFRIDEGSAMAFARTFALGLYHQRCGTSNALPFTRFTHGACHVAPAEVPSPQISFWFAWTAIASKNSDFTNNPLHTAPQLKDEAS